MCDVVCGISNSKTQTNTKKIHSPQSQVIPIDICMCCVRPYSLRRQSRRSLSFGPTARVARSPPAARSIAVSIPSKSFSRRPAHEEATAWREALGAEPSLGEYWREGSEMGV